MTISVCRFNTRLIFLYKKQPEFPVHSIGTRKLSDLIFTVHNMIVPSTNTEKTTSAGMQVLSLQNMLTTNRLSLQNELMITTASVQVLF